MENVMVSVIMSMYNAAEFITEAINSIIKQHYTDWELIVIDDGSTDASISIVKSFQQQDLRIRLYFSKEHSGLPATLRNLGISMAKGRYIAFLDSDDIWLPSKLAEQIPLFKYPQTAIVYSNYKKINATATKHGRTIVAPSTLDYKKMLLGNAIGNLTGIYDSAKTGTVSIRNIHHEDYAMWLSILKKGFIAQNTNTVTALYRVHHTSITSNKLKVLPWQWFIYRNIEKISFIRSCYYYCNYALKAFLKLL